ncbi:DUF2262 domain-containing protein [Maribacter spongiicola]|uniref:DUF2262 domain-containing protein n=1 Tax=Maribacter spongiicola TaxID=1206753 RepID=UPI003F94C978
MGLFSIFRNKNKIHLSITDFKTEQTESESTLSEPPSEEFLKSLMDYKAKNPDAFVKDMPEGILNDKNKSIIVTKTVSFLIFNNIVEIVYDPTELEIDEEEFIRNINKTLNWFVNNKVIIYDGIVSELLKLKNEDWLEENAEPLSDKQFTKCLSLNSILFFHDGSSQLGFDDGNLFFGHSIMVSLSKDHKFIDAELYG